MLLICASLDKNMVHIGPEIDHTIILREQLITKSWGFYNLIQDTHHIKGKYIVCHLLVGFIL